MKTIAKTLGVSRSNLIERVNGTTTRRHLVTLSSGLCLFLLTFMSAAGCKLNLKEDHGLGH